MRICTGNPWAWYQAIIKEGVGWEVCRGLQWMKVSRLRVERVDQLEGEAEEAEEGEEGEEGEVRQ
jgi:hypothetical protein